LRIGITTPSKSKYQATGPRGYPAQGPINILLQPAGFNQSSKAEALFPFQVLGPIVKGSPTFKTQTVFSLVDRSNPNTPEPQQDFIIYNFVNPLNPIGYADQLLKNWFVNEDTNTIPCFQFGIGFTNSRVIPAGSSISAEITTWSFDATEIDDPSKWSMDSEIDLFNSAPVAIGAVGTSNQVTGTVTLAQSQAGIPPRMVNYDNINLNIPQSGAAGATGVFTDYFFNLPEDLVKAIQDQKNFGLAIQYNIALQFAGEAPLTYSGFLKLAFRGQPIK
tara:strand:- start:6134 stop:6961 length:828 start_codon:yes stop_codon:yes gene_type:complete